MKIILEIIFAVWWVYNAIDYYFVYAPYLQSISFIRFYLVCLLIIIGTPFMEITAYYFRLLNWLIPNTFMDKIGIPIDELPEEIIESIKQLIEKYNKDNKDE